MKLTGVRQRAGQNEIGPGRRTLLHVRLCVGLGITVNNSHAARLGHLESESWRRVTMHGTS